VKNIWRAAQKGCNSNARIKTECSENFNNEAQTGLIKLRARAP